MASIPGTNIAAPVVPFDTNDQYATHDSRYGVGGWREVATLAERDAIPSGRRRKGMIVNVTDDPVPANNGAWKLGGLNSWAPLTTDGGGGTATVPRTVSAATTLTADDSAAGGLFVNSTVPVTVTVPAGLTPARLAIVQKGAGIVTLAPASGVTLSKKDGYLLQTSGLETVLQMLPSSLSAWTVFGDLAQASTPPVTLPSIIITPSTVTYAENATGQLAALSAVPAGATRTITPDDGRWVLNSAKTAVMIAGTPAAQGVHAVTITDTHPNATNSPRTATLTLTVTAASVPVTLPNIVIMPNSATYDVGVTGTLATITTPVPVGGTRSISPGDGRWVLSSDKLSILVGGTAATAGSYSVVVTDTHPNATNSPRTATLAVTVNAVTPPGPEEKILDLAVIGTGATAGTIHTFGHAFKEGDLETGDSLTMRIGGTVYPTQWDDIGSHWPDGSVRHAAIHFSLPAITDGTTQVMELWRDNSSAGTPINMATALSGKTCVVEVKNGANVFTYDCVANLGSNRWFLGARAAQTRLKVDIPRAAVGGGTNATLIVDLTVYSDGSMAADVVVWNYRTWEASQGSAIYDLKLTAQGVVQFTQASVTAPLYTGWGRRRRWNNAGTAMALDSVYVKPPTAYLARTGVTANYNTADSPGESVLVGFASEMAAGSWNTPYGTVRGLRADMGPSGDHPSIGETTYGAATWMITGDPRAARYAMGQAEAYTTVPWHMWDQAHNRWANVIDLPYRRTSYHDSEFTDTTQTLWNIDTGHMGDPVFLPYVMSARRSLLDALLGHASYSIMEKAPADFERGDVTRGGIISDANTDDGRAARRASIISTAEGVILNRGVQVRTGAWSTRQVVDAAIAPASEQPHGDYFTLVLEANIARWNNMQTALQAAQGQFYGAIAEWTYDNPMDGDGPPWQMDMYASALIRAARMKIAGHLTYLTWAQNWIAGKLLDHTSYWGADGTQYNLKFGTANLTYDTLDGANWVDTWAQLLTGKTSYGNNYAAVPVNTVGDYERRARGIINQLYDLFADSGISTTLVGQAREKVATWPLIKTFCDPDSSRADPRTNIVPLIPLVISAPVVTGSQSFSMLDNASVGATVGTVATTGGIPTGFAIVSGNTGSRFAISSAGVITVAAALGVATYSLGIQATNSGGTSPTVIVSVPVSNSLTVPVITAGQSFPTLDNATVGTVLGTVATTGGPPSSFSIQSGNTGGRFAISNTGELTVAAALVVASNTLGIRATNGAGNSTTVNVTVPVTSSVTAPVITAGQSFSALDNATVGAVIGTVLTTGGAPTSFAITGGNTGSHFAISSAGVITVVSTPSVASLTLTITATNAGGTSPAVGVGLEVTAAPPSGPIYGLSAGTTLVSLYGLRRLVHGYSGPLVRVRRTDNTEQDIGMDGSGNLDTSALTTFVGAARGYVTRWYDQSGAGRNLLQANTAKQPYITSAGGAVLTKTGKTRPNIHCAASRGFTSASMSGLGAAGIEMGATMAVELKSTTPNYGRIAAFLATGQTDDEAASSSMNIAAYANDKFFAAVSGYYAETTAVAINTPYIHTSAYEEGTPGRSRLNGTANNVGAATNYLTFADSGTLWVGLSNSGEAAGADIYISEFVFFRNFADADITLIENSMKTYEGIS